MMIPGEHSTERAEGRIAAPGGHKNLCPKCEEFRVHRASPDSDGAIRLECYTCHTSDRFVLRAGLYVYEPFDDSLSAWVNKYAGEVMNRPEEVEEPKARRTIFKRKVPTPKPVPEADVRVEPKAAVKPEVVKDSQADFDLTAIKTFADALAMLDGDYEAATDLLRRAKEARAK